MVKGIEKEEGQGPPDASSGAGRGLEPVGGLALRNERPPHGLAFPLHLQLFARTR